MSSLSNTLELVDTLLRPRRSRRKRPKWFPEELRAFKPPEKLTVSEWADKYRILDEKISARPGKWKTDYTPYLREVMDTHNDSDIEEVVFCCASQVGKSETLNNIVAYVVDQDPSPMLVVYPTLELAGWVSNNRLQPMLKLSPAISEAFDESASKMLELQFVGGYLVLSGANSPASLATRPVRIVLFDETDKYPDFSGKEADPISLGEERQKTFWNKKTYKTSTPTTEFGPIWQAFQAVNIRKHYYVPCPHCGHYQQFLMKQIKWPKNERNPETVRDIAWYECEKCKGVIEDKHKPQMLKFGEWRAENEFMGRIRSLGYHLNSIYSPWLTFGDVASEFLKSKDFPEKLRNFVNSWLGEPWKAKAHTMKSDVVLKSAWTHKKGAVPEGAVFLTAGVDVQQDHFWFAVRAWGENVTSWLVDWGRIEAWPQFTEGKEIVWPELTELLRTTRYRGQTGLEYAISLACIDSGFKTDEVYQYCTQYMETCRPTKGSSTRLRAPFTVSSIDKVEFATKGLKLFLIDTHYYKDFISGRLSKQPGEPGAWMVTSDCTREYADHITAEQRVVSTNRRTGKTTEEWKLISTHAHNHLLDCEVNAAVAADILGVRYLSVAASRQTRGRRVLSKGVKL
jgi:phage terminase large subunit GpA-like protein